jgi:hypothetical protein
MTDVVARAWMAQWGRRGLLPVPDALLAAIFALAAGVDFLPPERLAILPPAVVEGRETLLFGLLVEGGFLLMQGTLVDIATRLRKRPPWWAVVLIFGAVLLFSDYARLVLRMAWDLGLVVFVPLLLSLGERAMVLWRMPGRPLVEKIAARALIGNRITTGLGLFGLVTALMVSGVAFPNLYDRLSGRWVSLTAGAVYFAIAALDDWRVRGRRFAEKPSVLFRFDPIGIDYLEPV